MKTSLLHDIQGLFAPPAQCRTSRFHWLDVVRGLAAIAILIWHYQHFYYNDPGFNPIVYRRDLQPLYDLFALIYERGYFAVQLFWVISGFVFANVYANSQATTREFVVHRFARLYPLHFLTLLIVAALQLVSIVRTGEFQIYPHNDAYHFGLHLLFISQWGFQAGDSFNAPIWSVSIEILIYCLFWIVHKHVFRLGLVGPLALAALFMMLIIVQAPGAFWGCGLYFFLGSATYNWLIAFQNRNAINLAAGLTGFGVATVLLLLEVGGFGYLSRLLLFPSIVLIAASVDLFDRKESGKRYSLIGDLTYGIYLLHVPIQITLILLLDAWGVRTEVVSSPWFLLFFIALVVAVSYPTYRLFELPSRQWIRRRWGGAARKAAWPGAPPAARSAQ